MIEDNNVEAGIFHLVYVSDETNQLDISDIKEIEQVSQKNNQKAGVTGILMYKFGRFMQFLEGSENEVRRIFSLIQKDPRHTNIEVLTEGFIPKRQFSDWHMKYTPLSEIQKNSGIVFWKLFNLEASADEIIESAKQTLFMLLSFKNNRLRESYMT